MDVENYSTLQKTYPGQYIARRGDQVVANAPTLRELWEAIDRAGISVTDLLIERIEAPGTIRVY